MAISPSAQAARRWLTFSLRTLLLLITILCIWLGLKVNAARRQRELVATLGKNGICTYDYQWKPALTSPVGLTFDRFAESPWPRWLLNALGEDYLHDVIAVAFLGGYIESKELALAADLTELRSITLCGTSVATEGKTRKVQDGDLAIFRHMTKLRCVDLAGSQVTGTGLESLANASALRRLNLTGVPINDEGMRAIAHFVTLEELYFDQVENIGDAGISDLGIASLESLTNLVKLSLTGATITDASLAHLKKLTKLKDLDLSFTKVTEGGIADLQRSLPAAVISGP